MFAIAFLAAIAVFILLLAIARMTGLVKSGVDVSARVQQYGTPVRVQRRARVSTGSAFWDDILRSRFSDWAKTGANKFGHLLPKKNWFELKMQQANLPVTGTEYMMLVGGSTALFFVLTFLSTSSASNAIIVSGCWFIFTLLYAYFKAMQRMKAFSDQLGDSIVMLSNAIKSGFTFQQAMGVVGEELKGPMSEEFSRALNEVNLGLTLEEALEGICIRTKNDDFEMVAMAVVIQRQVGGNLSQILDTVGETIRDRIKLKGEIRALTAEGVISGWTIALLPIAVAFFSKAINPGYFDAFLEDEVGKMLIWASVGSEIAGLLVIRWILNVKI